jgi:hypothetical protein
VQSLAPEIVPLPSEPHIEDVVQVPPRSLHVAAKAVFLPENKRKAKKEIKINAKPSSFCFMNLSYTKT